VEENASPYAGLDREQLAALFRALSAPIVATDPSTGAVLAANPAFCSLLRLPLEEVVGAEPPYPWLVDESACLRGHVEATYRRADGDLVPVAIESRPALDPDGTRLAHVQVVTDRTAQRRLDERLVQSGRLAAVGELAAGVAHEVNNPLFAILGLTEFLAKDVEPGSKAAERLELIRRSGEEIKEIVRALLDFARENAEERQIVPIEDVVRQTLTLVNRTNAHKGIELVPTYGEEDALVWASSNQLKQVLLNLITNARQAMPDGGTVRVDVRSDAGEAVVTVEDDGPGIPPDIAGRIFEPFFTTKSAVSGTGLGLSVSLGIAQAHGGTLVLDTNRERGAAFVLRLPLAQGGDA
jgi:two-component system, NtrC family, sensor kinase